MVIHCGLHWVNGREEEANPMIIIIWSLISSQEIVIILLIERNTHNNYILN